MRSLLFLALLAAAPLASAEVPSRVFPSAAETGFTREQPQALSHWQKMAQDMADQAAPRLKAQGVTVSSQAAGQSSVFDVAFHDFFVTALYERGVRVTQQGYGARVEIDTYPLTFNGPRATVHLHDEVCHTHRHGSDCHSHEHKHCRLDHSRYNKATREELAVNVRVFDGGDLAFSGSTTYYLPKQDMDKYRYIFTPTRVEESRHGYRTLSGEYGTRTWGR